jgi:hypothetical protein
MESSNLGTVANDPKSEDTRPLGLQRCDTLTLGEQSPMFLRLIMSSLSKIKQSKKNAA